MTFSRHPLPQGLVLKTERKDAPSPSYSPPARAAVSERTSVRLAFSLSFKLAPLRLAANSRMRHIVMLSFTASSFSNRILLQCYYMQIAFSL